jgi:hypothetical protein
MLATESNFLAELERVVRGKRPTVDPRALLFVAAEVILQGSGSESKSRGIPFGTPIQRS